MKTPVSPHTVVSLVIAITVPLSAQNLTDDVSQYQSGTPLRSDLAGSTSGKFKPDAVLGDRYHLPTSAKIDGHLPPPAYAFVTQDSATLGSRRSVPRDVETVVDLDLLRQPSAYRKIAGATHGRHYVISTTGLQDGLAMISAIYSQSGQSHKAPDCESLALSVEQRVKLDPSTVLAVVSEESAANPSCVCEIVKSAIRASDADVDTVVAIAEVSILAAPEHMRMISQCAIAEMPDALPGIQSLLARLDPNTGDSGASAKGAKSAKSAKSAKGAKAAIMTTPALPDPLDLPPTYIIPPPPVFPPPVTEVNPR
jgi:hypothetical protein